MRLINNIVSFAKKYKILILICIIVYISFYYLNVKSNSFLIKRVIIFIKPP